MNFYGLEDYIFYTIISFILYFSIPVKIQYQNILHDTSTDVYIFDFLFALHSLVLTIALNIQYIYYKNETEKVYKVSKYIFLVIL